MQLQRRTGLVGLTFIALSGMLNSGWLFAPHLVAQQTGPAALVSWVIGGVVMMFLALTFAEVAPMLPVARGLARVPYFSHAAPWPGSRWVGDRLGGLRHDGADRGAGDDALYRQLFSPRSRARQPIADAGRLGRRHRVPGGHGADQRLGVALFARINTGITWLKLAVPLFVAGAILTVQFEGVNLATLSFSHAFRARLSFDVVASELRGARAALG